MKKKNTLHKSELIVNKIYMSQDSKASHIWYKKDQAMV